MSQGLILVCLKAACWYVLRSHTCVIEKQRGVIFFDVCGSRCADVLRTCLDARLCVCVCVCVCRRKYIYKNLYYIYIDKNNCLDALLYRKQRDSQLVCILY